MEITKYTSLEFLYQEHHYNRLLSLRIRSGLSKKIDPVRIKAYTDWFFLNSLLPHFNIEEDFIFPLVGNDHPAIKRALSEHRKLKRLFEDKKSIEKSLNLAEEKLEDHIRFEEKVVFKEVEKRGATKDLALIREIQCEGNSYEEWGDKFWLRTSS